MSDIKEHHKEKKQEKPQAYTSRGGKRFWVKFSPYFFQLTADFFAVVLSYTIHFTIRYGDDPIMPGPDMFIFGAVFSLIWWHGIFWIAGLYKNWYIRSPFEEFFTIVKAAFFGSLLLFFFIYLDSLMLESSKSPRFMFLIFFGIITFNTTFMRFVSKKIQVSLRRRGIITIPSIIIGTTDRAMELMEKVNKSPSWGFRSIGLVIIGSFREHENIQISGSRILGYTSDLEKILEIYRPMEALISVKGQNHEELMKIVATCGDKNVSVKIEPDLYDIFTGMVKTLPIYGIPLIEISSQLLKPWEAAIKRTFDIMLSLLVLIAGMPLWLLIAAIIKLEGKGPVFFKQKRIGKNGREFMIMKFRSMVSDAHKGHGWTIVNDPRVTKFGRIIRKTHLDEIPQFWNVLVGDMSVVGPRPEQSRFVEEFSREVPYYPRRLKVRPGITGWNQIKYSSYELSIQEIENRLKDDFYYIENISLKLDLEIIVRTVYCVVRGHGQA